MMGENIKNYIKAVSYTHLIVGVYYASSSPTAKPYVEAVSYTHLDVYKRQDIMLGCMLHYTGGTLN